MSSKGYEELSLDDLQVEIASGDVVKSIFNPIGGDPSIENLDSIYFRKKTNPRHCSVCQSELIKIDRIGPSKLFSCQSNSICAGTPYQNVYCGPRCFFPMGMFGGYIPGICDGFFGYCGCVATPVSVLIFPCDCFCFTLSGCNAHGCMQRRAYCNHPQCSQKNRIKNTCCVFDECTGYNPPLEFDESYYICPQCRDKANTSTCLCFTAFDNAADNSTSITTDFCNDCAFLPNSDDIVLTSNTYALIEYQITPVLALRRNDGQYDVRRNYFGPARGQTLVLSSSNIYKRVIAFKLRQDILKDVLDMDLTANPKYQIYFFASSNNDTDYDPKEIKNYAVMMDQDPRWGWPRSSLRTVKEVKVKARDDLGNITLLDVTYSGDLPITTKEKAFDSLHVLVSIES